MKNATVACRIISGYVLISSLFAAEQRITQPVDDSKRVTLGGNVSPRIYSGVDQGVVDPSMTIPYATLMLKPSRTQQNDLDRFLAQQQNPSSPDYHHWLTPEQYGDRFGVSQADLDKMSGWLGQHGLTVKSVARGHNSIAFGGSAGQIQSAFGVEIHHFLVGGELHYANTANPSVPAAFEAVISGVQGLHDFRLKPRQLRGAGHVTGSGRPLAHPLDTERGGSHYMAPDDFATIYDITPLYTAGINGAGQKMVIVGQTQLPLTDIQQYRSAFNLPVNNPTVMLVPGTTDPGISQGDLLESDLDVEISGAVAREAAIVFVYSENVEDAFHYAIDNDLAPMMSTSYGGCELQVGLASALFDQVYVLQANAEGMTVFAPSGDDGATDCVGDQNPPGTYPDNLSLAVDFPGSIPQVTVVGGTEFNEGSGVYWSPTNTANKASALSYIPEMVWNDSVSDGSPSGGGGGLSVFFDKPWWQAGPGVPSDGVRDVPDVSLSASSDHDGYFIYNQGPTVVGGTSAPTPAFAAITLLLGQYLVTNGFQTNPAMGQINPALYALSASPGVFHDVTVGSNVVLPCLTQAGCGQPAVGYFAGAGYDLASGLGSVDVFNMAKAWHAASVSKTPTAMTLSASAANLAFTDTTVLTATVTGGGAPSGRVTFSVGNSLLGSAPVSGSTATLKVAGILLAPGTNTISAQYQGDNTHFGAAAYDNVTVSSPGNGPPVIGGVSNSASFTQAYAPGDLISVFGTQLAPAAGIGSAPLPASVAGTSVTIEGVAAPVLYVSPTQLNVQIPYGIPPDATPALTVTNGANTVSTTLNISAVAPGIFTFSGGAPVPFTTAARGQEIFLFITGAGAVSPAVATGATPAAGTPVSGLPAPVGTVGVTVGGVTAPVDFAAIPTWSVGTVQINYTIPAGAPLGPQPVVVSVGGVASAAATLTVTQ